MRMIPVLLLVFQLSLASAFQVGPSVCSTQRCQWRSRTLPNNSLDNTSLLFLSSGSSEEESQPRKKRTRRRKEVATESSAEELKPRQDSAVSLQVTDIRELTGGKKPTTAEQTTSQKVSSAIGEATTTPSTETKSGDSLEMLLEDARKMQALEKKKDDDDGGFSVPKVVRNALSTLVTIDFFLICILLLWFLAGVFGSTVLKNDSIQIAFNSIFQPVVQPALGILMIAAISSAIFKEEEEED